jgi:hypothetical protein
LSRIEAWSRLVSWYSSTSTWSNRPATDTAPALLVIAGAGSGKTSTLAHRVVHEHADASHAVALLRPCHRWPRRRAPEPRDELPPSHPDLPC